jgi:hypothetical protein
MAATVARGACWCKHRAIGTWHLTNQTLVFGGSRLNRSPRQKHHSTLNVAACARVEWSLLRSHSPGDAGNALRGRAGPSEGNIVGCHKRSPRVSQMYPGRVSMEN